MAKWQVFYEIGGMCDSQEFDTEEEAQEYYEMIGEMAYTHESEGGSDTTVTIEEIEDGK